MEDISPRVVSKRGGGERCSANANHTYQVETHYMPELSLENGVSKLAEAETVAQITT